MRDRYRGFLDERDLLAQLILRGLRECRMLFGKSRRQASPMRPGNVWESIQLL
ncbi:MAG TPA: hypothetical protein VK138_08265 [Acidiferrobacterales bacterium]|nr:hypothetical protein [Acidiferrobacterales bacterium]